MYNNESYTDDWNLYLSAVRYNNMLSPPYYANVDTNLAFFNGDQWRNVQANGMPTPVFNIIKRVTQFFVSFIMSSSVKINYEPLEYSDDEPSPEMQEQQNIADIATSEVANLLDKFKFENRLRDACFDGATTGDFACHLYFDVNKKPFGGAFNDVIGEICFELVDGTNVFLGNANNPSTDVMVQPWIIVSGRDMTANLKEEAKRYKKAKSEEESIIEDKDYHYQAGDNSRIEIESDEYGKSLYIYVYKYDRKTKTVKVTKCTKTAYIYKDIDTKMSVYPVAFGNWEKQKNQYHGRALCTGLIPNQIFINRMFAMVMYNLMMTAFPKAVYDGDKVLNWSNEIGAAIKVNNLNPGDGVKNVAGYLEPGNMSNQIVQVIDLAIQYTKETLGINDAMMGNINPEQASGKSIIATVQQSSIPLENPKANLYEWVEDIGKILLDMMGTYYGIRPIVVSKQGKRTIQQFDFGQLKNIWLNTKTEVGASSYWSEISSVQTLDNLLKDGRIEFVDYLERLPEGYIPNKNELVTKIQEMMAMQQQQAQQQMMMQEKQQAQAQAGMEQQKQAQYEQMAQFVESLPQELQQKLRALPDNEFENAVLDLMQGGGQVA